MDPLSWRGSQAGSVPQRLGDGRLAEGDAAGAGAARGGSVFARMEGTGGRLEGRLGGGAQAGGKPNGKNGGSPSSFQASDGDAKVANRDSRVWLGVTENGP